MFSSTPQKGGMNLATPIKPTQFFGVQVVRLQFQLTDRVIGMNARHHDHLEVDEPDTTGCPRTEVSMQRLSDQWVVTLRITSIYKLEEPCPAPKGNDTSPKFLREEWFESLGHRKNDRISKWFPNKTTKSGSLKSRGKFRDSVRIRSLDLPT